MLAIRTFPNESVCWRGMELLPLRTRKADALLIFLFVEWSYYRRKRHRREFLADLLWPELDRSAGLNNLRQSLHLIREAGIRAGAPAIFAGDRQTVSQTEGLPLRCDLEVLRSDRAEELLRLPRESLLPLPNLLLYDAYPFQEWVDELRANVCHQAERAFLEAIDREMEAGNWWQSEQLIIHYLSRQTGSPTLYDKLATACIHQDKFIQAEKWLLQAGHSAEDCARRLSGFQQSNRPAPANPVYTPNPKAMEWYLSAWSAYAQPGAKAIRQSVRHFQRAIELDPHYSRAHLGLATALSTQGSWCGDQKMVDVLPAFESAIRQARHDPALRAEIDAVVGFTKLWLWEVEEATTLFRRATAATSNTSYGWYGLGYAFNLQGKHEAARRAAQHGINKDPYYKPNFVCLAEAELLLGRAERSEEICRSAFSMHPDFHLGLHIWMWALTELGRPEAAIEMAEPSMQRTRERPHFLLGRLALAYRQAGWLETAEQILSEMKRRAQAGEKGFPYFIALYLQREGYSEEALEWLAAYAPDRPTDYLWLAVQPEFLNLRKQPAFQKLLKSVFSGDGKRQPSPGGRRGVQGQSLRLEE